ncbi:MAG: hypothetical protein MUF71_10620 [Candidatus Kapabacteria bacterium]|jgi:hypothetical protein|nr:hypothetical protein [Candidatus Kapabacteria bacterium]
MTAFDHALESVLTLSHDEQDALLETVRKRRIEERRREIAENGREAIRAFHAGELREEPFEELLERLHSSLDSAETPVKEMI